MTHRWIKSSCVVVMFNAVLVLTSILHRQLTAPIDPPTSATKALVIEANTTEVRKGDGGLNPEVVEFQKLSHAGLAPNIANLEAKPVPEDDKLMAELRKKAAEAFPISEGLSEPQSIFTQSAQTPSIENATADTPLTSKSSSLRELSAALDNLAKLAQHFERSGDSAKVKKISEQIQALEKIMQELLATPAF